MAQMVVVTETKVKPDDIESTTDSSSPTKVPLAAPASPTAKSVRFSTSIDVREVKHWKDLPKEEAEATWYTPVEFEEIKRSLVVTIRLMMTKKPISEDLCTRGLEFRTPAGAKLRKKNKLKALTAVWNEQVAQWKADRTDDEAISFVYQQEVHECRIIARRLALQDQKDAQRYLAQGDMEESDCDFSLISLEDEAVQSLEEPRRSAVAPTAA
jgi:hypothetical protein